MEKEVFKSKINSMVEHLNEVVSSRTGVKVNTLLWEDQIEVFMVDENGKKLSGHDIDVYYRKHYREERVLKFNMGTSGSVTADDSYSKMYIVMAKLISDGELQKILVDTMLSAERLQKQFMAEE